MCIVLTQGLGKHQNPFKKRDLFITYGQYAETRITYKITKTGVERSIFILFPLTSILQESFESSLRFHLPLRGDGVLGLDLYLVIDLVSP